MTLKEFLAARKKDRGPHARIGEYTAAVERLMARLKGLLAGLDGLALEDWLPLLKEQGIFYNAPALTLMVDDDQITVEPVGAYVIDSKGRVRMSCGVKEVHLDWAGANDDWTFRWVNPRATDAAPFTDQAVEEIVQGLLS
jgi:hypothetical protein